MQNKLDVSKIKPLYDKNYSCPFCKEAFTNNKIRSRFVKPLKIESDFGPLYRHDDQNNPLYYYVAVCPACGFSFSEDFSKPMGEKTREIVNKQITQKMDRQVDYGQKRNFIQAVNTYKLAIYSAQLVGERHIVLAGLCHRLAWLYRGVEDKVEEKRFLKLAASEYEQAYVHSDFDPVDIPEIGILYLIGELNQKLGNYHEAVKFFTTVVEHPDKSRHMKYVKCARQQWKIAVEAYKSMV